MAIKSLAPYEFESRSAQKLYGDDMLVHVLRRDSMLFCSAVAVRVPQTMTWKEFVDSQVLPWCTSDPDFDAEGPFRWQLVEEDFTPSDDKTLAELGIRHKNTVSIDIAPVGNTKG
ncbi:phenol hydroxylase subunit P4 [Enemella evansiae]|uniref:phenol hydroxylase subunit P4 n=1 Tax=Enemella evansiae TaxID=2016499 RepID=UPI0010D8E4D1|nr:phenol hydroxylase subunit P4 [Enemella evansiae]TDO93366.1 phenol hydroxylase P4 protein [Enemella evansiae]